MTKRIMTAYATDHFSGFPEPDPHRDARPAADAAATAQEALRRVALAESLAGLSPRPAYSTVVLAGIVRLLEFCIMATTGFAAERVEKLRRAYRQLFARNDALVLSERLDILSRECAGDADVAAIVEFMRAPSMRPLCAPPAR